MKSPRDLIIDGAMEDEVLLCFHLTEMIKLANPLSIQFGGPSQLKICVSALKTSIGGYKELKNIITIWEMKKQDGTKVKTF
jgi:hypothetical protein